MAAPDSILELVERFEHDKAYYKSGDYNETRTRQDFIDLLFEALDWDINNQRRRVAAADREVILEYSMKIGETTKAPDYLFRLGRINRFFVEAKKPSERLKEASRHAFQVRRYAWSAQLPLSILTDFEEFIVYDCRVEPNQNDKADTALHLYKTYKEYGDKWDEIAALFHRDAVLGGSLERFVQETKPRKGTRSVDKAFLSVINIWRKELAENIAIWNPTLTQRELNYTVQMTLDRLVFLRIGEDRGIEPYGKLQALLKGGEVYKRLLSEFRNADTRYNSGLFHFAKEKGREEPDNLTPNIYIDDEPLKKILKGLYYPDSPYEFSVLSVEVLGNVYEQFLGEVITIGADRRVNVEVKPEVRKAGGVYYTPAYIVDYIVKHTLGNLLEGKTPKEAAKLRILDPACGSGSFLIGAYQFLLDWYRDQYVRAGPRRHRNEIQQLPSGEWRLRPAERKRILLNNVYGVDIDAQAVEVTKLSLSLKVLEGETQLQLFQERALPDLGNNIKCGNSLVGPNFYDNPQANFISEEEQYHINVFDWKSEFSEIMSMGGFDAVIGNPPYGYMITTPQQEYFSGQYHHQDYQKDLYLLFLEQYSYILKESALLGVIVSNTWLQSITLRKIRQYLITFYKWLRILHLPDKVFQAVVDTHVLIFQKVQNQNEVGTNFIVDIWRGGSVYQSHTLAQRDLPKNGDPINIVTSTEQQKIYRSIVSRSSLLKQVCDVYNGIKPFEKGKGTPPQTEQTMKERPFVKEGPKPDSKWSPLLRGSLIRRYELVWDNDYWVLYGPWLAAPRDPAIFDAPQKIMVRQTGDTIIATLIERGFVGRNNLHILLPKRHDTDLRYVLGLMNSRLMDFIYTIMNPEKGEALAEVKKQHVEQLPIRTIDFSNSADKKRHDQMVEYVERMLDLHRRLPTANLAQERAVFQRQIEATNRQIDNLVYDLYELTPQERRIIGGDEVGV